MSTEMSSQAKRWLTVALDPYHDEAIRVEGAPDDTVGRSYVRVHNQSIVVSPTADGDQICIHYTGTHGVGASLTKYVPDLVIDTVAFTPVPMSPINIVRSTSAVEPSYRNVADGLATRVGGFDTTLDITMPSRLIALAIEVEDVTADLYKKGSITGAHMSGADSHTDKVRAYGAGPSYVIEHQQVLPMKPATLSQLQSYTDAITRQTRHGAYIVARMSHLERPARFLGANGNTSHNTVAIHLPEVNGSVISPFMRYAATVAGLNDCGFLKPSGFKPFMLHLSGLPAEGDYKIVCRSIVEYFPDPSDLSNLGIAQPSPPFDPVALKVYHDVASKLPAFAPVADNASGDFWRSVKRVMSHVAPIMFAVAPPLLTLAGQPAAASVVAAAGAALRARKARQKKQTAPKVRPKLTVTLRPTARRPRKTT